jgi:putative transposase
VRGLRVRNWAPLSLPEARRIVADFVADYNDVRLHSAIGYLTPTDRLAGRPSDIFAERDRKLVETGRMPEAGMLLPMDIRLSRMQA